MFTPIKVFAAVALAAAIGSLALIAQPSEQGAGRPGAAQPSTTASQSAAPSVQPSQQAAGPALTSGTMTCYGGGEERVSLDDRVQGQVTISSCSADMDDPRVTGPATIDWSFACFPDMDGGCVFWGEATIEGPEGTWSGTYTGVDDSVLWEAGTGGAEMIFTLSGRGAYEGWTYVSHMSNRMLTVVPVRGLIYEGQAPPMEWPEPMATDPG